MSVNDTWMPLYLGDYLADTMHLNAAQHGAYLLLLMHYWRNGPLPDDDPQLAAIARCDARLWKSVGPVVRGFFRADSGVLHQKRMDQERNKWSSISDKRRDAGKAGAKAKWQPNGSHPPPDPNASRMANAINHPVDKYGKRIASAMDLPSEKWQTDGKCQDFAIVPLPSKNINSLSFKEVVPPPARESEPTTAEIGALRCDAKAELLSGGGGGETVVTLGQSLRRVAYAPGWSPRLTVAEQIAVATPPRVVKPNYLNPEQLAASRRRATS